jgi:hypothetical protein
MFDAAYNSQPRIVESRLDIYRTVCLSIEERVVKLGYVQSLQMQRASTQSVTFPERSILPLDRCIVSSVTNHLVRVQSL